MGSLMRLSATLAAVLIGLQAVGAAFPLRTDAANPTPQEPRRLILEAGTHIGLRFGSDGTVIARRRLTLNRPATEVATRRRPVAGHGVQLLVGSGALAGYYVKESIVAYVKGMVGGVRYDPPLEVLLPRGTVIGYRFGDDWRLLSARVGTVAQANRQPASRQAVINGTRYYELAGGAWTGTWVPRAGALTARKLDCTTTPRAPTPGAAVIRRVTNAGPRVALTFDMGGRLDPALRIMRYLLLNGVCTTIFPTGAAAQTPTGRAVLSMVSQYPAVFEVGNHTMNHCNLVSGGEGPSCPVSRPTDGRIRRELTDASVVIEGLASESPVPYWRPPYGAYDAGVLAAAASVGYTKTVMWDVDTIDWRPVRQGGRTAAEIAAHVVSTSQSGSVVLMHLGGYETRSALPAMLHGLRQLRDLRLTSISDLLNTP